MRLDRNRLPALTFLVFLVSGVAAHPAGAWDHRPKAAADCHSCGRRSYHSTAGPDAEIYHGSLPASGWDLLKAGRAGEALHRFGAAVRANPSDGIPKVGFSLAAANLGHLGEAVWVMRRALLTDPGSLDRIDGAATLQTGMEEVILRYRDTDLFRSGDADVYFMLAALYYMLDDLEASKKYVEKAGDGTASSRNLYRLIEGRVAAHRRPAAGIT